MNWVRPAAVGGASATIGALAWAGPFVTMPIALLVPALWISAASRTEAAVIVVAYQLAATQGAPLGIARYFASRWAFGFILWLGAALVVASAWTLLWCRAQRHRPWRALVALVVTAVPPIGIVGWVHPVTGAGALFPDTGWCGLLATAFLAAALSWVPIRWLPLAAASLAGFAWRAEQPALPPPGWTGVDTYHDIATAHRDPLREYERQRSLIRQARATSARVVVFPESAAGRWSEATATLWGSRLQDCRNRLVVLGAEVRESDSTSANTLIAVSADEASVVYRQRMPVPVSMWRPWGADGTRAYGWRNPVVTIAGRRAAVLICHEEVLVWPVLHSLACTPDVIVATANVWWCADGGIPAIQRNAVTSWARLFGLPCVMATNQ